MEGNIAQAQTIADPPMAPTFFCDLRYLSCDFLAWLHEKGQCISNIVGIQ